MDKILDKIIKPQYRSKLSDWYNYTKQSQLEGLQLINQIYLSKGKTKINTNLSKSKPMYETQKSLIQRKKQYSLQQAEQNFRRRQITTSYQFYHGGYSAQKNDNTNIFRFKTLQKLELSRPLTNIAVSFIDNWLTLKNDPKQEEVVLCCLRSMNSKIHLMDAHNTEFKTSYLGKQDWALSKPVRLDLAGQDLFVFKPNLSAIKKEQEKQLKVKEKLREFENSQFAKQMSIFKGFKIN